MTSNQLHINMSKCAYIHFNPKNTNNSAARCRDIYNNFKPVLSINGQKILPVKSTKFLGIIIDDKLCWDDQITYLENKLRGCLVAIKRIMTCIPKSQHINIYNSLFLSHMTYGINSWGGVPCYKLETLFAIQKRCVRLLFGEKKSFDHKEYYQTCARIKTYHEHTQPRNYCLEHTKPLFSKHKLLTLHCLYYKHMFVDTFKLLKYREPHGLYKNYKILNNPYKNKLQLSCKKESHEKFKYSFIAKSCYIWNKLYNSVLEKSIISSKTGYVIPGEAKNSDLSASAALIKNRVADVLLEFQSSGDNKGWETNQFDLSSYKFSSR